MSVPFAGSKPPEHEGVSGSFCADDDPLGLGGSVEAVELISTIHHGPDGYVTLASQHEGQWRELGAMEIQRLKTMLPEIANWLVKDSYFSLSSFFTQQMETMKDGSRVPYTNWVTDLPRVRRTGRNLRWLNTCFADIDLHDGGDFASLMADVIRLQGARKMPAASIIGQSGRGLWLFWLLHGVKDPTQPQPAWTEKVQLFSRIQHGIGERLHELGLTVDRGCSSPTALARVPGSVNTNAERDHQQVKYWIQLGHGRRPYSYNLYELPAAFGVPPHKTSFDRDGVDEEVSALKKRGWQKRWENAWEDFKAVRAIRGHFTEGTRSNAVFLQSLLLRKLGLTEEEIERDAIDLGEDCRPQLPLWKSRRTAKESKHYGARHISYKTCMDKLQVTPEEAAMLSHWPHPGREVVGRKVSGGARREIIRNVVTELGYVPSSRAMVAELGNRGVTTTHPTCRNDYMVLGLKTEPKPASRESEILPPLFAETFAANTRTRKPMESLSGNTEEVETFAASVGERDSRPAEKKYEA